jgi:hypothetical protein
VEGFSGQNRGEEGQKWGFEEGKVRKKRKDFQGKGGNFFM